MNARREAHRRQLIVWVLSSADAVDVTAARAAQLFERAFVELPSAPSQREATEHFRLERFEDYLPAPHAWAEVRDAVERMAGTFDAKRSEIDEIIAAASPRWRLERMPLLDRTLLRLGVLEMCFDQQASPRATINGMIELAKRLGSETTPAFVNGILDQIRRDRGIAFE